MINDKKKDDELHTVAVKTVDNTKKSKVGGLMRMGQIATLIMPMMCTIGIVMEIVSLFRENTDAAGFADFASLGIGIVATGLLTYVSVCICIVERMSVLRCARIVALVMVLCASLGVMIGFLSEVIFGKYLYPWLSEVLSLAIILLFYYYMIIMRIRTLLSVEDTTGEKQNEEAGTHNYYLAMEQLFHKKDNADS